MSEIKRDSFGHDTTTDEVLEGINLTGKLALVTGGSSGLGAETARAFAAKGASVVITARQIDKARGLVEEIRKSTGNNSVEVMELELGSYVSIRAFAAQFHETHKSLNILVNNAGVMACPFEKTMDGFEMQFGTNHLGHFLMTGLIAPAMIKGAPARIVSLSSRGHQISPVVFEDINYENREYDKWSAYGQAKTANVLHAVGLDSRLSKHGVRAYAVHPGDIQTELSRHMDEADLALVMKQYEGSLTMKTISAGAATSVYAATAPELEDRGGVYLHDCQITPRNDDGTILEGVRSWALDPDTADRLWDVSEEMVGERFNF